MTTAGLGRYKNDELSSSRGKSGGDGERELDRRRARPDGAMELASGLSRQMSLSRQS
jgi:hypothetical protein